MEVCNKLLEWQGSRLCKYLKFFSPINWLPLQGNTCFFMIKFLMYLKCAYIFGCAPFTSYGKKTPESQTSHCSLFRGVIWELANLASAKRVTGQRNGVISVHLWNQSYTGCYGLNCVILPLAPAFAPTSLPPYLCSHPRVY